MSSSVVNLQDVIADEHLKSLELKFYKNQDYGVDFELFKKIIFEVVGDFVSEKELHLIFLRVDSNSSGYIDWNGFITYMLNELQMRDQIITSSEAALKSTFHTIKTENQDVICKIGLMPFVSTSAQIFDYSNGRYVTVSKDGFISLWTQSWQIQKSKQCIAQKAVKRQKCAWMLEMACLCNLSVIAISSADETIKFYDCSGSKIDYVSILEQIGAIVTCMDYWFDEDQSNKGILIFGDSRGNVTILHFLDCLENKMFGAYIGKRECQRILLKDIILGHNEYCYAIQFESVHDDWVKQIRYIPRSKSVLTCSLQSNASMVLQGTTLEKSKRTFKVNRGISCFDYDTDLNVIATGSIDRCLRVWNPFITGKSVASFYGHSTPITHVMIIREVEQVVSVAADKSLRVWDMKDQTCIQSVLTHTVNWGPYPITAAFHNKFKRQVIVATIKIVVIERTWEGIGNDNTIFLSHHAPMTGMLFSDYYNQLVTASRDGVLTFWDLETGRRNIHIPYAHWIVEDGVQTISEISAIALDESERKLLTAGGDFLMKMWNLSNGALAKTLQLPDKQEITTIVCAKNRVFFAGWSRRVFMCNDNLDLDSLKAWPARHVDDILDMSYLNPNLIVTSSWDGRIRIWVLESGSLKSTLTLHQHLTKKNFTFPASGLFTGLSLATVSLESNQTAKPSVIYKDSTASVAKSNSASMITRRSPAIAQQNASSSNIIPKYPKISPSQTFKLLRPTKDKWASFAYQKDRLPAVTCLQCLVTREVKPEIGNLLLADITGMIQVWSTHASGGPLAVFSSISVHDQYTTCMATTGNNKFLVTGDSLGYIRIWYIRHYYNGHLHQQDDLKPNSDTAHFPFMRTTLLAVAMKARQMLDQFRPKQFSGVINTDPPVLLSCYRGHLRSVVQILLIDDKQLLLSASTDQSVRLWTMDGRYLVTFGDGRGWNLTKLLTMVVRPADRKAPQDIRRVGSAITLQVLMSGLGPRWWKLRKLFLYIYVKAIMRKNKEGRQSRPDSAKKDQAEPTAEQEVAQTQITDDTFWANIELIDRSQSPIGKYFAFERRTSKPPPLPNIPKAKKEMNAVHSYLRQYPLQSTNLDEVLHSVSPRIAAKLKALKG